MKRLTAAQRRELAQTYRRRAESLQAVDRGVAAIYHELEDEGLLENTYIFFLSDNGFLLGEHRIDHGKVLPYEESVRVPLAVTGPGVPRNETSRQLAANVDLAATFADIARATPQMTQDGMSLLPAFYGHVDRGREILLESFIDKRDMPSFEAVRTHRWTLVDYRGAGRELYDNRRDPHQLRNLYRSRARDSDGAVVRRLQSVLRRLEDCSGESCR